MRGRRPTGRKLGPGRTPPPWRRASKPKRSDRKPRGSGRAREKPPQRGTPLRLPGVKRPGRRAVCNYCAGDFEARRRDARYCSSSHGTLAYQAHRT